MRTQIAQMARTAKAVKREDVMRDALTFYVLRMTLVAVSANIASEIFLQVQIILFSNQLTKRAGDAKLGTRFIPNPLKNHIRWSTRARERWEEEVKEVGLGIGISILIPILIPTAEGASDRVAGAQVANLSGKRIVR